MRRKLSIPDIHGEIDKLNRLLDEIVCYDPNQDQLVLLGDYVDRGSQARQVVERVKKLQKNGAIALAGNHEWMMVDAVSRQLPDYKEGDAMKHWHFWMLNGGHATFESYDSDLEAVTEELDWIQALPLWHEDEKFFYSHAPIPSQCKDLEKAKQDKPTLIWSYGQPEHEFARTIEGKVGVCGHVHALFKGLQRPRFYEHYYFLDAGCGVTPDIPLVAVDLAGKKVYYSDGRIESLEIEQELSQT